MKIGYYHIYNGQLKAIPPPPAGDPDSPRLVILFSCGITSFMAAMLALEENHKRWGLPVHIIYTHVVEEPDDNLRFLEDAEKYFGHKVLVMINE